MSSHAISRPDRNDWDNRIHPEEYPRVKDVCHWVKFVVGSQSPIEQVCKDAKVHRESRNVSHDFNWASHIVCLNFHGRSFQSLDSLLLSVETNSCSQWKCHNLPRQHKNHTEKQSNERVKHQNNLHYVVLFEELNLRVIDIEQFKHLSVRSNALHHVLHHWLIF